MGRSRRCAAGSPPSSGRPELAGPGGAEAARTIVAELVGPLRSRLADRAVERAPGQGTGAAELTAGVVELTSGTGRVLGVDDVRVTVDGVRDHAWGLGPLQPLIDDPQVTDVLVNAGGRVWVDRGQGLAKEPRLFGDETQVRALAVRLAALAGRRLDEGRPWVDARLPGGVRLHAVVPPVSPEGTHLSLRALRGGPRDLAALVRSGSVPPGWSTVLEALVRGRAAFLVTGGTGAGKTTLLAALLSLVPADERLVLVEDVGELRPEHPHVVRLEARHANVEGRGAVGLDELVRQALRMRPDRLVVGECRGPEVRDLLAALNTGHAGGCGTLHANAPAEVPARLEALAGLAGMERAAVHAQAAAGLDAVLHVVRTPAGRRVVELSVVDGHGGSGLEVVTALRLAPGGSRHGQHLQTVLGPGWPALADRLGLAGGPGDEDAAGWLR